MKILHLYKDFDPPVHGGMERHIALMCRYQREWADVAALTCSRSLFSQNTYRDETPVREVGEWFRFQSAPASPLYPWYMRRTPADVMVVHVPNPTAELGWLLARPKGKLVVRYHSDVVRQAAAMKLYKPFLMNFLDKADIIIPTSQRYLDTSETLAPFADKCRVVSLGIVPSEFTTPDAARVAALREKYGKPFVLFAGRHRYYKGLEYLIKAAPQIDAHVVIAGDGPIRAEMMKLAETTGVEISFPGTLTHEDLVAHLHATELVVFPSVERSEAFGISIMEAHACGTPVVATTLGTGVEFINAHGETGLNVPPKDSEALAAAVNRLLGDEDARQAMGCHARERILRDLDARNIARDEFELYRDVLNGE